jgi:phosphohistidine swiveling domain-containing protein
MILSADALITAKGGSTSHAAVAIHGVDDRSMFAVMSVGRLRVDLEKRQALILDDYDNVVHAIDKGDVVSLHGTSGTVYLGSQEVDRRI